MQACLSAGKVRQSHFNRCSGLVKLVQAHFCVRKDRESGFQYSGGAVFITVEWLTNAFKPVYVLWRSDKAISLTVAVFLSSYKHISVSVKIEKAVFNTVVVLSNACKPV